jgi:hypothetical protein
MNYSELQARTQLLCSYAGWSNVDPPPEWDKLVNRGLHDFSWESEYRRDEAAFETLADQTEYTIAAPYFKHVLSVIYSTDTILRQTTEIDEARCNPLWTQASSGTPYRYLIVSPNVLRLMPKPDTASVTITVRGVRAAAPLVGDNQEPDFPEIYHEAVALRAAVLHGIVYAKGGELERLAAYEQAHQNLLKDFKAYLSAQRYTGAQRVVAPPSRRRVYLDGGSPY